jgi:hypothetical protein|tara:strand:- start:10982 stop:11395 length:414 start_codon:yes stop_codon:yes gene_type:complete
MSLLLYSPKCKHSVEIINFIQSHEQLKHLIHYHNVSENGIPPQYRNQITKVPTLLSKNGKLLVGREIHNWLQSLLPVQELETCGFGGITSTTLDGESSKDMFALDSYGQSLQPAMTSELEAKISRKVEDSAYTDIKK